ncbi:MAG: hypothetical protein M1275_03930 [Patescibacteria group bacterium]|nr:hypothetical protein [Patescibacteria group bacterium]
MILTVAAQPAWIFAVQNTEASLSVSGDSPRAFYAISLESPSSNPIVVLTRSAGASLAVSPSAAGSQISVVAGSAVYPVLKVVTLDLSGVKLSVGNYRSRAVVVRVLPVAVLSRYELSQYGPFDPQVLGVFVAPAFFRRFQSVLSSRVGEDTTDLISSFGILAENSSQTILVLRC